MRLVGVSALKRDCIFVGCTLMTVSGVLVQIAMSADVDVVGWVGTCGAALSLVILALGSALGRSRIASRDRAGAAASLLLGLALVGGGAVLVFLTPSLLGIAFVLLALGAVAIILSDHVTRTDAGSGFERSDGDGPIRPLR